MKRVIVLFAVATLTLAIVAFGRGWSAYQGEMTCVAPEASAVNHPLAELARSGDLLGVADAFAGHPDAPVSFDSALPPDLCFAERLYVQAANAGNNTALERLGPLYNCGGFGRLSTANASAAERLTAPRNGSPSLQSTISVLSYVPNPFACPAAPINRKCPSLDRTSEAWRVKQAILCDGTN